MDFVITCITIGLIATRLAQIIQDLYECIVHKLYSPLGIFTGAVIIFLINFVIGFILHSGYNYFLR